MTRRKRKILLIHSAPWALERPDGLCTILCGLDPTKRGLRNGHTPDQDMDELYGPPDKLRRVLYQGCPGCVAVWEKLGLKAHPTWKRKVR